LESITKEGNWKIKGLAGGGRNVNARKNRTRVEKMRHFTRTQGDREPMDVAGGRGGGQVTAAELSREEREGGRLVVAPRGGDAQRDGGEPRMVL